MFKTEKNNPKILQSIFPGTLPVQVSTIMNKYQSRTDKLKGKYNKTAFEIINSLMNKQSDNYLSEFELLFSERINKEKEEEKYNKEHAKEIEVEEQRKENQELGAVVPGGHRRIGFYENGLVVKISTGIFSSENRIIMKTDINDMQLNINGEHYEFNTGGAISGAIWGGKDLGALLGARGNKNNAEVTMTVFYKRNCDYVEETFATSWGGNNSRISAQVNLLRHYFNFLTEKNNNNVSEENPKTDLDRIEQAYEMMQKGAINEEEFSKIKGELL